MAVKLTNFSNKALTKKSRNKGKEAHSDMRNKEYIQLEGGKDQMVSFDSSHNLKMSSHILCGKITWLFKNFFISKPY